MIKISSSPLLKILYLLSFEIQEKRDGHSSKIIPVEVYVLFFNSQSIALAISLTRNGQKNGHIFVLSLNRHTFSPLHCQPNTQDTEAQMINSLNNPSGSIHSKIMITSSLVALEGCIYIVITTHLQPFRTNPWGAMDPLKLTRHLHAPHNAVA